MRRFGRIALVAFSAVLVASYAAYTLYEQRWFLEKIPAAIEVDGVVSIRGGAVCGAAVFELSKASQEQVLQRGLRYFQSARQARGRKDVYHSYDTWRETLAAGEPASGSDLRRFELSVSCAALNTSLEKKIIEAARKTGSYVTTAREKVLLVAPAERLVVLAYWD